MGNSFKNESVGDYNLDFSFWDIFGIVSAYYFLGFCCKKNFNE